MLKFLRIVLSIVVLILAWYGLITGDSESLPYMMFFMGAMLLVIGISEIKKEQRRVGFISIIVSLFVFYVSMEGLLLN